MRSIEPRLTSLLVLSGGILLMSAAPAQRAGAQPPDPDWVAVYSGPGTADDQSRAVAVDPEGNVYVSGQTGGAGTGLDYLTVKYDAQGAEQWSRVYNGPGNADDIAHAIAVDADGNVYVTGVSYGTGGTEEDYATIKYGPDGDLLWARRYDGPAHSWDEAFRVVLDDDGFVLVTGRSNHSGIWFDFDYLTIKYDAEGDEQWTARYNGAGNDWDQARGLGVDEAGNVYVTGTAAFDLGTAYHDYATLKYSPDGVLLWTRFFDGAGSNWDEAVDLAVTGDGTVYVTGYSSGSGTVYDYVTIRYSTDGDPEWTRTWMKPGLTADVANDLALDSEGNVYVTGSSVLDYATVKYDSDGNERWARFYGAASVDDIPYAVAVDGQGHVYVTGKSANRIATVKYDAGGAELWAASHDGSGAGENSALSLTLDLAGNVYVAGYSGGSGTGPDATTIKYVQETAALETTTATPGSGAALFLLRAAGPNPSWGGTSVELVLLPPAGEGAALQGRAVQERHVVLSLFDPLGRRIQTLVDEPLAPGTYRFDWDASHRPAGTYFLRMTVSGESITRRITLIR